MTNVNVGFVIDENYVKYCSVTIVSILENKKTTDNYVFHIIHDGSITEKSQKTLCQLCQKYNDKIFFYAQNKILHHEQRNETRQDIPAVTNYRLMISSILFEIDKVIFMDADLICLSDLSELYNIDLGNYLLACCPGGAYGNYPHTIGIPSNYKYCNTGVMLANLKSWRTNDVETLLFTKEKEYRGIYLYYDQCIFNIALYDKIKYIDQKFNYRPSMWNNEDFVPDFQNPCILHWAQREKPWQNNQIPYAFEYFKYVDKSPYKWQILKLMYENKNKKMEIKIENIPVKKVRLKALEHIFSLKNLPDKKHKQICILGLKFKIKKS